MELSLAPATYPVVSPSEAARVMHEQGLRGAVDIYGLKLRAGDRFLPQRPRLVLACVGDAGLIFLNESETWGNPGAVYAATAPQLRAEAGQSGILWAYNEAALRARGIVALAEYELAFLKGILNGSGIAGVAIVVGMSLVQLVLEHGDEISTLGDKIARILESRACLKKHAPALYEQISSAAIMVIADEAAHFWDGVKAKDAVALIGYIVAKIPLMALKRDPLVVLGHNIGTLLHALGIVLKTAIAIGQGTVNNVKALAREADGRALVSHFRRIGATIDERDAVLIFQEIRRNPLAIANCLSLPDLVPAQ